MIDDTVQPITEPIVAAPKLERTAGKSKVGGWAFNGISHTLLMFWALMVIFPFLWMIMTSFKSDPEILFSPWKFPDSLQWNNFSRAWNEARMTTMSPLAQAAADGGL